MVPWPTKDPTSSPPETAKALAIHACGFLCLSLFCARAYPIPFARPCPLTSASQCVSFGVGVDK
ncbi:hypothetical protein BDV10DRAFT_125335 [Aspergillus recurvatus]